FQAEDGIRDYKVTGVQTCALPIYRVALELAREAKLTQLVADHVLGDVHGNKFLPVVHRDRMSHHFGDDGRAPRPGAQNFFLVARSEERRVGKECRSRGWQ